MILAALRPTDWNWVLLGHVGSALVLVGGLIALVIVSVAAHQIAAEHVPLLRALAFRINLLTVIPAFVAVHVFGGILSDREYHGHEPSWLSTGFAITSISTIVAIALLFLQFWVLRRVRAGTLGGAPAALATWLWPAVLAAMIAVLVLMAGKPAG